MTDYQLGTMEQRFAEILWRVAPIPSGELIDICAGEFGWKKSTTYTMLRRLCQKGLFANTGGTVSPLLSQDEFKQGQSRRFLQEHFNGSLPRFLASFGGGSLNKSEIAELEQLISKARAEQSKED